VCTDVNRCGPGRTPSCAPLGMGYGGRASRPVPASPLARVEWLAMSEHNPGKVRVEWLPVVDDIRNSLFNPGPELLKVLKRAAEWAEAG